VDLRSPIAAGFLCIVISAPAAAQRTFSAANDSIVAWADTLRPYSLRAMNLRGHPRLVPDPPDRELGFAIRAETRVGVLITTIERAPRSWHEAARRYADTLHRPGSREPRFAGGTDVAFEFPIDWHAHGQVRFPDNARGQAHVVWLAYRGPSDESDRAPLREAGLRVSRERSKHWPSCPKPDVLASHGRRIVEATIDLDTNRVTWITPDE
jgi:hypothetical protein